MRKSDHAYYLELKGFPKWRITFGKALTSIILGEIFVPSYPHADKMALA